MIDPGWTAAALIGAPLLLLPALALRRYIRRKAMLTREQSGLRATRLDEIFHGIQAVKLNRMEDYQTRRFAAIIDTHPPGRGEDRPSGGQRCRRWSMWSPAWAFSPS